MLLYELLQFLTTTRKGFPRFFKKILLLQLLRSNHLHFYQSPKQMFEIRLIRVDINWNGATNDQFDANIYVVTSYFESESNRY